MNQKMCLLKNLKQKQKLWYENFILYIYLLHFVIVYLFQQPPIMTLKGHKENISAVQFINDSDLLTASWDHTIKLWDGEIGGIKTEIVGNKSFFNQDYSSLNGSIITCSSDRHIRLYDLRSKGKTYLYMQYTAVV